jgi:hypothetical protein
MKSKNKKPAKAVTLLRKIETLLADAVEEFSVIEESVAKTVRELLLSAEASIAKAQDFITPAAPRVARHTAAKSRPRAKAKRAIKAKKVPAIRAA